MALKMFFSFLQRKSLKKRPGIFRDASPVCRSWWKNTVMVSVFNSFLTSLTATSTSLICTAFILFLPDNWLPCPCRKTPSSWLFRSLHTCFSTERCFCLSHFIRYFLIQSLMLLRSLADYYLMDAVAGVIGGGNISKSICRKKLWILKIRPFSNTYTNTYIVFRFLISNTISFHTFLTSNYFLLRFLREDQKLSENHLYPIE